MRINSLWAFADIEDPNTISAVLANVALADDKPDLLQASTHHILRWYVNVSPPNSEPRLDAWDTLEDSPHRFLVAGYVIPISNADCSLAKVVSQRTPSCLVGFASASPSLTHTTASLGLEAIEKHGGKTEQLPSPKLPSEWPSDLGFSLSGVRYINRSDNLPTVVEPADKVVTEDFLASIKDSRGWIEILGISATRDNEVVSYFGDGQIIFSDVPVDEVPAIVTQLSSYIL